MGVLNQIHPPSSPSLTRIISSSSLTSSTQEPQHPGPNHISFPQPQPGRSPDGSPCMYPTISRPEHKPICQDWDTRPLLAHQPTLQRWEDRWRRQWLRSLSCRWRGRYRRHSRSRRCLRSWWRHQYRQRWTQCRRSSRRNDHGRNHGLRSQRTTIHLPTIPHRRHQLLIPNPLHHLPHILLRKPQHRPTSRRPTPIPNISPKHHRQLIPPHPPLPPPTSPPTPTTNSSSANSSHNSHRRTIHIHLPLPHLIEPRPRQREITHPHPLRNHILEPIRPIPLRIRTHVPRFRRRTSPFDALDDLEH